ncbi:hypothetical protein LMG19144_02279 [Xanthomonas arboricola pv. fragariae]|nr:hypothetical protein LMG19144_02279 [Xanthomonas arboricola pv. fragariae]
MLGLTACDSLGLQRLLELGIHARTLDDDAGQMRCRARHRLFAQRGQVDAVVVDVERAQHLAVAVQDGRHAAGDDAQRRRNRVVVAEAGVGLDVLADHLLTEIGRARARRPVRPDRRGFEMPAVLDRKMRRRAEAQHLAYVIQHHHRAIQRNLATRFHARCDGVQHYRQRRAGGDQAQDGAIGGGFILDQLAFGDIGQRADMAEKASVAGEMRRRGIDAPTVLPVVTTYAVLGQELASLLQGLAECVAHAFGVVRMHHIPPALVHCLVFGLPGEVVPARIPVHAVALRIGHPDHCRHRLAQGAEAHLAFAQLLLERTAVMDIGVGADPLADAAVVAAHGQGTRQMPAPLAIVALQLALHFVGAFALDGQRPGLRG